MLTLRRYFFQPKPFQHPVKDAAFSLIGVCFINFTPCTYRRNGIFRKRIGIPKQTGSKRWLVRFINCFWKITKEVIPDQF